MGAASTISRLAIGDTTITPVEDTVRIPTATVQDDRASDDLPFGSRGGVSIPYHFPSTATTASRWFSGDSCISI